MARRSAAKYGDTVLVYWEDASSTSPWMDLSTAVEYRNSPPIMRTVGSFISVDKVALMLCSTMAPDETIAGVWRIPFGMVRKMEVLHRFKGFKD